MQPVPTTTCLNAQSLSALQQHIHQETSNPTSVVECMPGRQQWGQGGSWTANACSSDVSEVEEDEVIDVDATDQVNSMQPHTNIKASRLITLMCHSIDKVHEACLPCACSQYCVPVSSIMTTLEFGHSRQVQPSTICTIYFRCTRLWRVWCCNLHPWSLLQLRNQAGNKKRTSGQLQVPCSMQTCARRAKLMVLHSMIISARAPASLHLQLLPHTSHPVGPLQVRCFQSMHLTESCSDASEACLSWSLHSLASHCS